MITCSDVSENDAYAPSKSRHTQTRDRGERPACQKTERKLKATTITWISRGKTKRPLSWAAAKKTVFP
jgi:hypothetical protein